MKKTYIGWRERDIPSTQREYTEPVPLLGWNGELQVSGWARRNVFRYERDRVQPLLRRKEWDFYQISDGRFMAQVSFANITLGGYASAVLVDLRDGRTVASSMAPFAAGADRYALPARGDAPNLVRHRVGDALFEADTGADRRTLRFRNGDVQCHFAMDIPAGTENITTVLPFAGEPDRFFLTTKQNCLPCAGIFRFGRESCRFSKEDSFCVMDWGRVCTPYSLVWYWGNGSAWIAGPDGGRHRFGFELTWGIGDESNATETCLFYDGVAHKIEAVDVETFPKPDRWMEPWHFISEDGRFDMTMVPFYDHHTDLNIGIMRMHSHQVHGLWSGTAVLDGGERLDIRDMYAFCEYVENRW